MTITKFSEKIKKFFFLIKVDSMLNISDLWAKAVPEEVPVERS